MRVTHAAGVRNDLATVVKNAHDVGAGIAVLQIRDGTTVLLSFPFADPSFSGPVAAVITLNGTPIPVTGITDGVADNFLTRDQAGTSVLAGSVTISGFGGDIEMSNTNVATGQAAELDSLTYEASP